MPASELQTSSTAHQGHGKPAPGLNLDALLAHLRATLPDGNIGKWKIVSFKALPSSSEAKTAQASGDPQEPKTDDPSPANAPIKPGGPKIEVVYEWTEK